MQQLIYVPGMKPSHGINILTGDNLPNAAVIGTLTPISFAKGQSVTSKLVRIDDVSTLHKSLGVDVAASGSYMGFSANAKVDFADECNFNSHSTYLLIHVEVTNAFMSMDDPIFTPDAIELLKNQNQLRFRERYGDVFIAGVSTGGEYFAVYQISGTDESEKEKLAVEVNASYQAIVGSADLQTKINSMCESSKSHLEVKTYTFQLGGSDTSMDITPEQIIAKAHNFAPSVQGEFSVPYSVLPASYRSLKLPDDAFNPIDIENQRQALADAWALRNDLLALKNDIDYILLSTAQNHEEFETFDVAALTKNRNNLADQISQITKGASNCMRDANQCQFSTFDISGIILPKRSQKVMLTIADNGQAIALNDPILNAFRNLQPEGPARIGYDTGVGTMQPGKNTLWGPGSRRIQASVPIEQRAGFDTAAEFCLALNNNVTLAEKGFSISQEDSVISTARVAETDGFYWLGFDIATGIFGDPSLGALGNTLMGPGSEKIRSGLNAEAQKGFNDAFKVNIEHRKV